MHSLCLARRRLVVCSSSRPHLRIVTSRGDPCLDAEILIKIYDLPTFSSTLEISTMLALSTGRLLKVRLSPSVVQNSRNYFSPAGWHPRHVLLNWNYLKLSLFFEPPALHAAHIPSAILGNGGQAAPGSFPCPHRASCLFISQTFQLRCSV